MVLIKVAYNIETGGLRTTVCTIVVLSLAIFVQSILTIIIFQVNRVDRSHKLGCVPGIPGLGRRILRTIGIRVGIAQVTADLHPLGDVVVNATTDGVSVEFRGDQDTPVIQITRRQIVAGLIRTSGNTDLIILSIGLMVGQDVHPVFVPSRFCVRFDFARSGIYKRFPRIVLVGIVEFTAQLGAQRAGSIGSRIRHRVACIVRGVPQSFPGDFDKFVLRQHVVARERTGLKTKLGLEVDIGVTGFTAFGGNHDDAVGTTSTIQSGSGSVFQNGQVFNIRRVDG